MKLKHDVIDEQEIKKSRFLTYLKRTDTEEQARSFIAAVRREHPSATHHCTAMKIGAILRSNDDGEPSGTAGRPMLDVLEKSSADCLTAVVVRYFGGTLLGKGGLVRAYSSSVAQALEKADYVETIPAGIWQLRFEYDLIGRIDGWLRSHQIEIQDVQYSDQVSYLIISPQDPSQELARLSQGKLTCRFIKSIETEQDALSHN